MLRHLHLIVNPHGGVGNNVSLAHRAEAFLQERGIRTELHLAEYAGHARALAAGLVIEEGAGLCGIGGDGTMHELINGIMRREDPSEVPIALLPGGTGNAFLRDLGLLDPAVALERVVAGVKRTIDLFEVRRGGQVTFGFNLVGWGLVSEANRLAERLRFLGRRRYNVAGLCRILVNRSYRGELECDGERVEADFTLVAASNTRRTGAGLLIAPGAEMDDGKLDVIYLRTMRRTQLLRLFTLLQRGQHIGQPGVESLRVERFRLSTAESVPVNLDGELLEGGSFEVKVRPGAVHLLV